MTELKKMVDNLKEQIKDFDISSPIIFNLNCYFREDGILDLIKFGQTIPQEQIIKVHLEVLLLKK